VARGQEIFNHKPFEIAGVRGLNDEGGRSPAAPLVGTCTTCHNAPNVGSHSLSRLMDIGISSPPPQFFPADMPRYTLRNKATGETLVTSDPGRALITGKWADRNKFKVPVLRGLAARAPYFHNGSIADLEGVVRFYNGRFQMGLTEQEQADLAAFLRCL
jgi:cytochrome c peroxidase